MSYRTSIITFMSHSQNSDIDLLVDCLVEHNNILKTIEKVNKIKQQL